MELLQVQGRVELPQFRRAVGLVSRSVWVPTTGSHFAGNLQG